MDQDTDVSRALRDAVSSVLDEVRKAPPMQQIVSQPPSPAPQPAPPWHAWVCATSCIVMFALMVVVTALFLDLSRKYDRMQDHLSAIYMMAPQLKPKE